MGKPKNRSFTSPEKHKLENQELDTTLQKAKSLRFTPTTKLGGRISDGTLAGLISRQDFQQQVFSSGLQTGKETTTHFTKAWNPDLHNHQIYKSLKEWQKVGNSGKTLLQEAIDKAWAIHDKWVELYSLVPSNTHSDHLIEDYYNKGMHESRSFARNLRTILDTYNSTEINDEISKTEIYENLYKDLKEGANRFWKNNPRPEGLTIYNKEGQIIPNKDLDIHLIWKDLSRSAQESFIEVDNTPNDKTLNQIPQDIEGSTVLVIQKKGWNITPLPENNSILELTRTKASDELTYREIEDFCREQLEIRLKNITRKGLEQLIEREEAPLGLLKNTKDALDDSQTSNIFHWEQLIPKSPDYWYAQNLTTKKIHIGVRLKDNPHEIEEKVLNNLRTLNGMYAYSKKLETNFALGINKDNTIKATNSIAIAIEAPVPKSRRYPTKIHIVITDKSEVLITDSLTKLSKAKYKDSNYINNRKKDNVRWIFHEIDPW